MWRVVWLGAAAALSVLVWSICIFAFDSATARAGTGRLDPSFGKKGWTETPRGTAGEGHVVDVLRAPGGETVVADPEDGLISRLLPDGSVDRRLGHRGVLSVGASVANGGSRRRTFTATSVAVDSRGRLVVFGEQTDTRHSMGASGIPGRIPSSDAVVLRFDPDGMLDRGFGDGKGFIRSDFGLTSSLSADFPFVGAMTGTIDSEDRPILVAGVTTSVEGCYSGLAETPAAVVRLTTAGIPDRSFGSGGVASIAGAATGLTVLTDNQDQFAVGVGASDGGVSRCRNGGTVYRLDEGGRRQTGFGPEGLRSFKAMRLAALSPAGQVFLDHQKAHTLELTRLTQNGVPDPNFGEDGLATVRLPARAGLEISSVIVDHGGSLLLAGFFPAAPAEHQPAGFVVMRVEPDGRLDSHFGDHGRTVTEFPSRVNIVAAGASLDSQNRLVIAGTTSVVRGSGGRFVAARYLLGP